MLADQRCPPAEAEASLPTTESNPNSARTTPYQGGLIGQALQHEQSVRETLLLTDQQMHVLRFLADSIEANMMFGCGTYER